MDFRERVKNFLSEHRMICPGDTVCAGFSGGADSLCLLTILHSLSEEMGFSLHAMHMDHCLRGSESDGDRAFAEEYCRKLDIPLHIFICDIKREARIRGTGTEEAGRLMRRKAFALCRRKYGADKIALAHQMDDLAETFLFHACRGSSLRGMASIRPVQGDIIRPLLCVNRAEIEEELTQRGLSWRTDSTNLEDVCTRNVIRHRVLPCLTEEINAGTLSHIAALADEAAAADAFLTEEARRRAKLYVSQEMPGRRPESGAQAGTQQPGTASGGCGKQRLAISDAVMNEPGIIRNYILLDVIAEFSGGRKDLTRGHVQAAAELFGMETGSEIHLPKGVLARKSYGCVELIRREAGMAGRTAAEADGACGTAAGSDQACGAAAGPGGACGAAAGPNGACGAVIPAGEAGTCMLGDYFIRWKVFGADAVFGGPDGVHFAPEKIPAKTYTKWFDYDKISGSLVFRTRRSGDYIVVNSAGGRKKLKDYLIDEKVPRGLRDRLPVLASGSHIYWVTGSRIGEDCKVTEQTKRILEAEIVPPEMPGRE